MDEYQEMLRAQLDKTVEQFRQLQYSATAKPRYNAWDDTVLWEDEIPANRAGCGPFIRYILALRIRGARFNAPIWDELWVYFKQQVPEWPGFRADRCDPERLNPLHDELFQKTCPISGRKRRDDEKGEIRKKRQMAELFRAEIDKTVGVFRWLRYSATAKARYNIWDDTVIWDDEIPPESLGGGHFIRHILGVRMTAARSSTPISDSVWDYFKQQVPGWPGFRAERCDPERLIPLYNELKLYGGTR